MNRSKPLERRTELRPDPEKVREFQRRGRKSSAKSMGKRGPVSPATPAQRIKVRLLPCIVCGDGPCHPMHLLDRSLCPEGADDPRAVVAGCPGCHVLYDDHKLDLLPFLEPFHRIELAFAVERFGLVSTYKRVTGDWDVRVNERSDEHPYRESST